MEEHLIKISQDTGLLVLNSSSLKSIFAKAENNPIAIVAVLGASCASKRTIITEITKGLTSQSASPPNVEPGSDLSSSNENTGIWIVNEPYIITKDEKNTAVFVMFVQGPLDSGCSANDTSSMMMLSVLLSSVVVINIPEQLTSDIVDIFQQPLEFANLVKSEDSSVTPFQYLDIVISNWTTGGFTAGKKGGSKYLKEHLEEIILEAQSDGTYPKLKSAFTKMECFLLPEDSPAKQLKKFFETISEKQLGPKLFLGNEVTADSFLHMSQELVGAFNKSSFPKPRDLLQKSVAVNIQVLADATFTQFMEVINDSSLSNEAVREKAKEKVGQMKEEGKSFGKIDECTEEFMKRVDEALESRKEVVHIEPEVKNVEHEAPEQNFSQSEESDNEPEKVVNEPEKKIIPPQKNYEEEQEKQKEVPYVQPRVKRNVETERKSEPEKTYSEPDKSYVDPNPPKDYEPLLNEMVDKIMAEVSQAVGSNPKDDELLRAIDKFTKKAKTYLEDELDEEEDQVQRKTLKRWDEKVREIKNSFLTGSAMPSRQSHEPPPKPRREEMDIDKLSISSGISSEYGSIGGNVKRSGSNASKKLEGVEDIAIGIDLGTTYCCMGVVINGGVKIIPNAIGKNTTPSYLVMLQNGEYIIGEAAKKRAAKPAETKLFNVKRIIGRPFSDKTLQADIKTFPYTVIDEEDCPKIQVGDNIMYPEEVSAKLLENLVKDAEKYLQQKVTKVVITVPAYFNDTQRKATVQAGEMAGLEVLGIMTEPTAAAIAYNLDNIHGTAKHFLVFDLGGGTFDVALFKSRGGNIECLAIDGDTHLGGEDFDLKMVDYCVEQFKRQTSIDFYAKRNSKNKRDQDEAYRKIKRIQMVCEKQKEDFCSAPETEIVVDAIAEDYDMEITMSKYTFEEINKAHFEKTIEVVQRVLQQKGLKNHDIDDVILIGGSAKITKIQELLKQFFERANLNNTINPDEAVAYGAAVHAAALNAKRANSGSDGPPQMKDEFMQQIVEMNVQDITPISYGIEVNDGRLSVIIPRHTKIPSVLTKMYTTAYDYAPSVAVEIFQGEHPIARQNSHLGKFVIDGIPKKKAGEENVKVDMSIDDNGILVVTATIVSTKHTKTILVDSRKSQAIKEKITKVQQEMNFDNFSRGNRSRRSDRDQNFHLYADGMGRDYE